MKYFTDRPMERVMMELPHTQRDRSPPQLLSAMNKYKIFRMPSEDDENYDQHELIGVEYGEDIYEPILPDSWRFTIGKDKQGQFDTLRTLLRREDVSEMTKTTTSMS
mgnify:CR=1 FL=1